MYGTVRYTKMKKRERVSGVEWEEILLVENPK